MLTFVLFHPSLSAPVVSECSSAYNNLLTRQINQRIAANKTYGNTLISGSSGLKFTDRDGNSYGFNTASGGVTEYDGAMMDKTMPDNITVVKNTDTGAEVLFSYSGKKYRLTYDKNGDVKSNIKLVEVTE